MTVPQLILAAVALAMGGWLVALTARWAVRRCQAATRRRVEAEHRALLNAMPVGLYRATADYPGRLIRANRAMAELLGYSSVEQLLAEPVAGLYEDPSDRVRLLGDLRLRGQIHSRCLRLHRPDGQPLWAEVSLRMVSQTPAGPLYDGVIMDVTDRVETHRRLEASEREYRELVEQTQTGYVLLDAEGKVLQANAAYARLAGRTDVEEVIGHCVDEWTAPESPTTFEAAASRWDQQRRAAYQEVVYLRPDGGRTFALLSLIGETGPDGPRYRALCRDVSRLKSAESELRKARDIARVSELHTRQRNSQLEASRIASLNVIQDLDLKERTVRTAQRELAHLNVTLESKVAQRTAEVRKLLDQKGQFIYRLGHDLRTGLTPLVALVPLLRDHLAATDEADQLLSVVQENIAFLRQLVDNALQLASLTSEDTRLDVSELQLEDLVGQAVDSFGPLAKQHEVHLQCHRPHELRVRGDAVLLRQLVHNLISNAITHSTADQTVTVIVRREAGQAMVAVSDEGKGMSPDELKQAFEEFYKADPARHDRSATGLGLAISQRIAHLHGGTLELASQGWGQGTTARLLLPTARTVPAAPCMSMTPSTS